MSRLGRLRATVRAGTTSFLRRRTAVFFTFAFPLLLVAIFGAVVQTGRGGGLFGRPAAYYVPGYLAVVALFTPLTRVGSEVARNREHNRFEKLATTPLSRREWLLATTIVNVGVVGVATVLVGVAVVLATSPAIALTPLRVGAVATLLVPTVATFCGLGAVLGALADSRDGVVAAANGLALPLVFLSETFVHPSSLPTWLPTWLSPLSFFARGTRAVLDPAGGVGGLAQPLAVLTGVALVTFLVGAWLVPVTD